MVKDETSSADPHGHRIKDIGEKDGQNAASGLKSFRLYTTLALPRLSCKQCMCENKKLSHKHHFDQKCLFDGLLGELHGFEDYAVFMGEH